MQETVKEISLHCSVSLLSSFTVIQKFHPTLLSGPISLSFLKYFPLGYFSSLLTNQTHHTVKQNSFSLDILLYLNQQCQNILFTQIRLGGFLTNIKQLLCSIVRWRGCSSFWQIARTWWKNSIIFEFEVLQEPLLSHIFDVFSFSSIGKKIPLWYVFFRLSYSLNCLQILILLLSPLSRSIKTKV